MIIALIPTLFAAPKDTQTASKKIAQLLGWTPAVKSNLCEGYYQEPNLSIAPQSTEPLAAGKIQVTGLGPVLFSEEGTSILQHAIVSEPGRRITADEAELIRDPTTHKINLIHLRGHVILRTPGRLLRGESAEVILNTKEAHFHQGIYHLALDQTANLQAISPQQQKIVGLSAWGKAYLIHQVNPGLIILKNASFSTCSPLNTSWHMQAQHLTLNRTTGRGVATHSWLYLKNIPVMYLPYINFPIDKRRKTGILYPSFHYSSQSGMNMALPIYFNLMPNLDFTLTPNIYTKRGIFWDTQTRYLTQSSTGYLNLGFIHNDRAFSQFLAKLPSEYPSLRPDQLNHLEKLSHDRRYISWHQDSTINRHVSAILDFNHVSDDYFFQDFDNTAFNTDYQNQLLQQAYIQYKSDDWFLAGLLQHYQTLHPVNYPVFLNQYARLPQFDANYVAPFPIMGANFSLDSQAVRFTHSFGIDPNTTHYLTPDLSPGFAYADAYRWHVQPTFSYPVASLAGHITPQLSLDATQYDLFNSPTWPQTKIDRTLPIFSIDSGLVLQRNLSLLTQNFTQTLEPRLHYLYVPYKNQNTIPVFDSLLQTLTYDQLFRNNRFSGFDRIGDANQIAYGVTSRFLNGDNGIEKMRVSIGQIRYFQHRLVTINNCATDQCLFISNYDYTKAFSPIVGKITFSLIQDWELSSDIAWDPYQHHFTDSSVTLSSHHRQYYDIYLNYTYTRSVRLTSNNQTTLAGSANLLNLGANWYVTPKISMLGLISNENILNSANAKSFYYGLQYDTCCWAARVVTGRQFTGFNQFHQGIYDKRIYFQIMLKGIGGVGNQGSNSLLASEIPGYNDIFTNHRTRS
ncbi:MAG: LPS-assembly protein LptD [Legionellales bacterium]|nr:LPS-assembly protein LptD [Legionellales bacterium]